MEFCNTSVFIAKYIKICILQRWTYWIHRYIEVCAVSTQNEQEEIFDITFGFVTNFEIIKNVWVLQISFEPHPGER